MPFGLRLKRTRRYNVSNKNCFVIRIKLLDTSVIECTLSVESTGQECLEAAAQRLELRELAHFGLWYSNKQQQLRWVDLEKPLRKQLDKFAQEALLHFGVLFYVPSEIQLQQEVTRYQYYLQLKKDIIEGKLPCSVEQSVRLASLAVQADFGDYDQYQSQEFLRDYILFPMVWAQDDSLQEEMTVKVAIQHQNLRGLIAEQAELVYIREVEKLDGFGHESFPAKESTGTDLTIGTAFQGIFVKYKSEKAPALYKWSDITNVTHNKAFVGLELMNKEETVQFQTDDIEMAKYVWRMFSLKHKFYRLNKSLMDTGSCNNHLLKDGRRKLAVFSTYMQTQNTSPTLIRRRSTLTRSSMQRQQPYIMPPMQMQYNEPYTETHMSSQDSIYPGQQDNFFYRSETSLDRYPLEYAGQQVSNGKVPNGSVYSAPSLNSLNNHSQGFLQQQQQQMQQQQQPSPISSNLSIPGSEVLLMRPDYVPSHRHSAIIVPSYRPTPDYETVMRQFQRSAAYRMERHSQSLRSLNLGSAHAYAQPEGLVYSQPEIRADHHGQYPQQQQQQQQQQHHHYPLQMNYSHPMQPTYLGTGGHPCSYNTPAASAISHTVSTPELTQEAHPATAPPPPPPAALPPSGPPTQHLVPTLQQQQQQQSYGNPAGRMLRGLLSSQSQRHPQQPPPMAASGPPPPYPRPRPAASTPDLVAHQRVCSSNPDLVSRRVLHSVQTFQEDSLPVVHRSLLEVSEPLTRFRGLRKRNSLGATPPVALTPGANGLAREVEALAISRRASGRPRPIVGTDATVIKVLPPSASVDQPRGMEEGLRPPAVVTSPLQQQQQELELQRPQSYSHKKSPSDATVLIHSSESEGEGEVEIEERQDYVLPMPPRSPAVLTPQEYKSHLQAVLANIPKRPPPEYPGGQVAAPQRPSHGYGQDASSFLINTTTSSHNSGLVAQQMGGMSPLVDCKGAAVGMGGASLGPSVSEPDLSSAGKERVRTETPRERPVSEFFSLTDNIVEREFLLHKRGNTAEIKKMGPLKMAVMNGLSMSRIPLPEEVKEEPPKVPMDERCKMLQERLEQGMVFTEYERVLKKRAQADCSTATLSENHDRNRFKDVVPYEENRIELLPSKDNPTGYVNASRIQVTVSGEEWHYIATQGPLPSTCQDFWQMVWEEGVNVIAMVTQEEEGGKSKSHRYWPKLGSRHSAVTYGKFKVTTKFRTDFGCYATTGLKLKHLLDGHERTVWHLQYTDWPDHGCPDHVQGFLGYLEEIKSVRRHTNNMLEASKPANPPVVVHCSAGVGRTGVVILTEMMIACLEHNEKLDVPDVLAILRTQRMLMVQTITQYTFVYQALIQFLRSSRLI
ncbi:tyrosine-protein phosphatase non-receptor type 14 isoform X1 [Petromyzon marinus]|uniref:protein-tyrosine-phosphatase n=1 Tax=Petromyzon marinus TaxID=7757 RepID=A0AAJ7TLC1_PETMA|nr:tyrosine-protein phosphatase non-receptor type 14-like isoform X1 [Petromyzon marinus]